ncbi:hypothetical protein HYH03_005151 [Edaphochlamys debaryana]|uniref:Glycosyl transferase CAP10 domain-containing protein n=1 Tax=Edaphochlamys debaryana TaxID=47281 RepID=A0A835Y5I9_9CHLO|nr:hypothetical protein HYH03_005151 [Edaphochlamys debaryana]|eukprot:KAG2496742.1 hypothetical protein HYH03_005151 [Edaphochlamys debaryana]
MEPIYKQNLDVDFRPWVGRKYSVRQLYELVSKLVRSRNPKYLSLVVVLRGNVSYFPLSPKPNSLTSNRMNKIVEGLRNGTKAGLVYPNSVYIMNVWDEGRCNIDDLPASARAAAEGGGGSSRRLQAEPGPAGSAGAEQAAGKGEQERAEVPAGGEEEEQEEAVTGSGEEAVDEDEADEGEEGEEEEEGEQLLGGAWGVGGARSLAASSKGRSKGSSSKGRRGGPSCTVPLFSLIKSWDYARGFSHEPDVLLPFFNHYYQYLYEYPWEKKYDKALMRAALQAQSGKNCTRMWILALQRNDPDGQRLLDAGITNNLHKKIKIKLANFVTIPDHARWRYLLSADGFTASCRLGKLMGTNSVVLKEVTPWIEYYYRSLTPNKETVPFTKDSVLDAIKGLEQDPDRAKKVSAAAQQFAFTYLSQHSKAMYVRRALQTYNGLFEDMDAFMSFLKVDETKTRPNNGPGAGGLGLTLLGLLEQMKAFTTTRS